MKTLEDATAESQALTREMTEAMLLQNGLQLLREEQRLSQKNWPRRWASASPL